MRRYIHDIWIFAEDIIGAIPVVDVDIYYGDTPYSMGVLGVAGSHGNIIVKAEPHRLRRGCMMTGWTCERKRGVTADNGVDGMTRC
jgi:hypothetical protein